VPRVEAPSIRVGDSESCGIMETPTIVAMECYWPRRGPANLLVRPEPAYFFGTCDEAQQFICLWNKPNNLSEELVESEPFGVMLTIASSPDAGPDAVPDAGPL